MRLNKFFFFFLILLPACHSESPKISPSKPLIIATSLPIGGIDPFKSRSGIGANIIELLYRPLYRLDAYSNIHPEFAKEVRWENNERTVLSISFNEESAKDVKASIEKARELGSGDLFEGLKNLNKVEIISPSKIHFVLNRFDRAFLVLLSQIPIVRFSEENRETGEFSILRNGDDEIFLGRKIPSPDKVNQIQFKVIPSSRRAMRELVAGNIDFIFFARESDFKVLTDIPGIVIDQIKSRILYQILENRKPSLYNRMINWRKLAQLINKENLFNEIGNVVAILPEYPVPNEDPWYPKNLELEVDSRAVWMISGKKVRRSLSFLGEQSRDRRLARILKRSFEEVGIDLALLDLAPEEFNKNIFVERKFDLVLLPFNVKDALISNILVFHSPDGANSLNFSQYSNPEVDKYLDLARHTFDESDAKKYFSIAMQELTRDPPGVFLFWLKIPVVMRDNCSGFRLDTNNEFFSSLKDVRCEPSAVN